MRLSIIVPTFNRHEQLIHTLEHLRRQTLPPDQYEVLVVDDGSTPPVVVPENKNGPRTTLIRFDKILERCRARNAGAQAAAGEILLFLDDDLEVCPGFLEAHLRAHAEWPEALVTGHVCLPPAVLNSPLVRFRQHVESAGAPRTRGVVPAHAVGGAGNMSIGREKFLQLGGFDSGMVGIEDQDFNLRYLEQGGIGVFLPEADAIHWDHALDIRSYCKRTEWAAACAVAFARRYPDWPINQERDLVNGPVRWGREPLRRSLGKFAKLVLGLHPFIDVFFGCTRVLEWLLPDSRLLKRHYSMLMGIHWLRGYRQGLRRVPPTAVRTEPRCNVASHLEESKA